MTPLPILTAYRRMAGVYVKNIFIILLFSVLVGGIGAALSDLVASFALDVYSGGRPTQNDRAALVMSEIPRMLTVTFWEGLVGAFAASVSIYLWVAHERGETASLRDAVNFAMNRFGHVWKPHLKAFAMVFWGAQFAVPGILFGMQLPYVDAIATLDPKEPNALVRSTALTRPRRGAIFRALLPAGGWWIGYSLLAVFYLQDKGILWIAAGGVVTHAFNVMTDLVMVQLYLDEVRRRIERAAEKKRLAEGAAVTAPSG